MTASRRKVGIIGIGFGAQVYVPAFASEGWDVAALCSRHADKARKAADAAGIAGHPHRPAGADRASPTSTPSAIVTPPGAHHELDARRAGSRQARAVRKAVRARRRAGRRRCATPPSAAARPR